MVYIAAALLRGRSGRGGRVRVDVADNVCTEQTGGRALTRRSGGQGGKGADSRANGWKGPTRHGHADGRKRRGRGRGGADWWTGGQAVGQMGGLGGQGLHCTERWVGRTGGQAVGRMGGVGGRGLHCADGESGGLAVWRTMSRADWQSGGRVDRRTDGRGGGPGFKRPHSTRPISLLGAQSACLIRARVRKVPGSAVGSSRIPSQTPVLSAWTHLPSLSASVLGAEKGFLFSENKKWI